MEIKVIYKDKGTGIVKGSELDHLIKSGTIAAYCCLDGEWSAVGGQADINDSSREMTIKGRAGGKKVWLRCF